MVKSDRLDITGLISVHKLATIAVSCNFGLSREHFFYRRNMDSDGLQFLVQEFVEQLVTLRVEMVRQLPSSIKEGLDCYYDLLQSEKFKKRSIAEKAKVFAKIRFLKNLLSLRIYSWNGSGLLKIKYYI